METVKFTLSFIKKLAGTKPAKYADSETPGLQIKVSARKITYLFYKKHNYKLHSIVLGNHPDISLEEARTMALDRLAALANYSDVTSPVVHKSPTVKEAIDLWLDNQTNRARAMTAIKYYIHLQHKKIADLHPADVEAVFYSMSHIPAAANKAVKALKTAINNLYKKIHTHNPVPYLFDGIKLNPYSPRKRILLENEAPNVIEKLKEYSQYPRYAEQAKAMLLMLYTGQRKSRVFNITAEQIDVINHVWYVPGNKIKRPVTLKLNSYAWELITAQMQERPTGYLFLYRNKPMKECRKTFEIICRECGISNLHLHDFRRSLGSWMISSGASIEAVKEQLGHSSIKVTEQVYAHLLGRKIQEASDNAVAAMFKGKA